MADSITRATTIKQTPEGYFEIFIDLGTCIWKQDTDYIEGGRITTPDRAKLLADHMNAQLDGRTDVLVLIRDVNNVESANTTQDRLIKQTNIDLQGVMELIFSLHPEVQ